MHSTEIVEVASEQAGEKQSKNKKKIKKIKPTKQQQYKPSAEYISFQEGQPEETVKYWFEGAWTEEIKSDFGLLNQQVLLKAYFVYLNSGSQEVILSVNC